MSDDKGGKSDLKMPGVKQDLAGCDRIWGILGAQVSVC